MRVRVEQHHAIMPRCPHTRLRRLAVTMAALPEPVAPRHQPHVGLGAHPGAQPVARAAIDDDDFVGPRADGCAHPAGEELHEEQSVRRDGHDADGWQRHEAVLLDGRG